MTEFIKVHIVACKKDKVYLTQTKIVDLNYISLTHETYKFPHCAFTKITAKRIATQKRERKSF